MHAECSRIFSLKQLSLQSLTAHDPSASTERLKSPVSDRLASVQLVPSCRSLTPTFRECREQTAHPLLGKPVPFGC